MILDEININTIAKYCIFIFLAPNTKNINKNHFHLILTFVKY